LRVGSETVSLLRMVHCIILFSAAIKNSKVNLAQTHWLQSLSDGNSQHLIPRRSGSPDPDTRAVSRVLVPAASSAVA
jgi:hypothetical protein